MRLHLICTGSMDRTMSPVHTYTLQCHDVLRDRGHKSTVTHCIHLNENSVVHVCAANYIVLDAVSRTNAQRARIGTKVEPVKVVYYVV